MSSFAARSTKFLARHHTRIPQVEIRIAFPLEQFLPPIVSIVYS